MEEYDRLTLYISDWWWVIECQNGKKSYLSSFKSTSSDWIDFFYQKNHRHVKRGKETSFVIIQPGTQLKMQGHLAF